MRDVAQGLHGNGHRCPACALRREEVDARIGFSAEVPCNQCGGTGWVQFSDRTIVEIMAAAARQHYWPEREKVFAAHNRRRATA